MEQTLFDSNFKTLYLQVDQNIKIILRNLTSREERVLLMCSTILFSISSSFLFYIHSVSQNMILYKNSKLNKINVKTLKNLLFLGCIIKLFYVAQ